MSTLVWWGCRAAMGSDNKYSTLPHGRKLWLDRFLNLIIFFSGIVIIYVLLYVPYRYVHTTDILLISLILKLSCFLKVHFPSPIRFIKLMLTLHYYLLSTMMIQYNTIQYNTIHTYTHIHTYTQTQNNRHK